MRDSKKAVALNKNCGVGKKHQQHCRSVAGGSLKGKSV